MIMRIINEGYKTICDECKNVMSINIPFGTIVRVGDKYKWATKKVNICSDCLRKAVSLFDK